MTEGKVHLRSSTWAITSSRRFRDEINLQSADKLGKARDVALHVLTTARVGLDRLSIDT